MKKVLLSTASALLLMAGVANAQYYLLPSIGQNPKGLSSDAEWPVDGGLPAGWTTVNNLTDTAAFRIPFWSADQTIPFAFSFNGAAVTSYKVSTSGVLTFDVASVLPAPSYTNAALPSAAIPDKSICVWGLEPMFRSFVTSGSSNRIITKTFGTAPNRQHWIQFNLYGDQSIQKGWTFWSIVLEETSNNIYIVDQKTVCVTQSQTGCTGKTSVTAGIQYNSTSALSITGSPNLQNGAGSDPGPSDNRVYEFIFGTQPSLDFSVNLVNNEAFGVNKAGKIYGSLRNLGATTVTGFTLNYQIDADPVVSATISAVSIGSGSTYVFEHPTPVNFTAAGNHAIKVWASALNGAADEVPANDAVTKNVVVSDNLRVSLHEIFSSSTCGPCAPGNANYKAIVAGRDKNLFTSIKYQQNFPGTGDPYSTTESVNRRGYYSINSIPRMEIDGQWDGNAQSFTNTLFNNYQTAPPSLRINATYQVTGKIVDVKVRLKSDLAITGDNNKLYVAVIEGKTSQNVKTNGETEFLHVMKKMLPNENGVVITGGVSPGEEKVYNLVYTFPGDYTLAPNGQNPIDLNTQHSVEEWSDIEVVVFVQNSANRLVLQSANAERTAFYQVGVNEVNNQLNAVLYPNPTTNSFVISSEETGRSGNVRVMDLSGKEVMGSRSIEFNNTDVDCSGLSNGIYFVEITSGGKTAVQKLVVAK